MSDHSENGRVEPAEVTAPSALSSLTIDDGPTEADIAVDSALADLVRVAYHDRWLRARLQTVEDGIRDLRLENETLRVDLAAAFCRMDDMEGYSNG